MDPPLLQQLQLSSEYPISPVHDCIDPIASHGHHSPYINGRESLGTSSILSLSHGNSAKCITPRQATESSYSRISPNIPDSGSVTGSTSNRSSVPFTFSHPTSLSSQAGSSSNLQGPFLGGSPIFGTSYNFSSNSFHQLEGLSNPRPHTSILGDTSNPNILHSIRSPSITTANSHGTGTNLRESYTTSTPGIRRHLSSRTQLDMNNSFHDSRPMLSPQSNMNYSSTSAFGTASPIQPSRNQPESPPFESQENFAQLKQEDGSPISVTIDCKIEKGFFISGDNCWTCYRRNYFSVYCTYSLQPLPCGRNIYLERHNKGSKFEQVQAMAVCLSAVVDGTAGKPVDLVQHTPKRDRGPQTSVQRTKIMPKPMIDGKLPRYPSQELPPYTNYHFSLASHHTPTVFPNLPLQQSPDSNSDNPEEDLGVLSRFPGNHTSPNSYQHMFERIQFKSATANNGKRRAQQQYYHLIVELWADVRTNITARPEWIKVAQRLSSQVVVRGRSPSHYSNEGPNSIGRSGTSGGVGGSTSSTTNPHHWTTTTTTTSLNSGVSSAYQPPLSRFSGTSSSGLPYGMNVQDQSHHRSHHDDQTTAGSSLMPFTDSSHADSLRNMSNTGSTAGYHYIPTPLYEAGLASPSTKPRNKHDSKGEDDPHGSSSTILPVSSNNCRLVRLDSSQGIYTFGSSSHDNGY